MNNTFDVVVVGAGSNSLCAAAYLAQAGLKVGVFESNPWVGGGVVTQEVTAQGFKHDLHSTAHMFLQANPMIQKDELGLQSKFGLEYVVSEEFFTSLFPDGSSVQSFVDLDATCASIAKHSQKDAETYRAFVALSQRLLPLFRLALFNPPAAFGTFMALLDQSPDGRILMGDLMSSPYDMCTRMFENEKVQMHFMRWASEGMFGIDANNTGSIMYMMCSFIHMYGCKFPKGGSGELSLSLQRSLEHYGGTVEVNAPVKRLIVSGGKATGVELNDGRVINARKAVLASVHPKLLNDFVGGTLDDKIQASIKKMVPSQYSAMNTHYALHEPPRYKANVNVDTAFGIETQPATMEEFRQTFDSYRNHRIPEHLSVLSICTTNHDPSRAPAGKHTLYLYSFMPFDLADGGSAKWKDIKESTADRMLETLREYTTNMGPENIIARHVDTPTDFLQTSASFQDGDICGTGLYLHQFFGRRPTPELANYAVPGFPGLYLVGPFMHPGAGVIGGGRPVAIKVLKDLGMSIEKFSA